MRKLKCIFIFLLFSFTSFSYAMEEDSDMLSNGISELFPAIFQELVPEKKQFLISKDLKWSTSYIRPDNLTKLSLSIEFIPIKVFKQRLHFNATSVDNFLETTANYPNLESIWERLSREWASRLELKDAGMEYFVKFKQSVQKIGLLKQLDTIDHIKSSKKISGIYEDLVSDAYSMGLGQLDWKQKLWGQILSLGDKEKLKDEFTIIVPRGGILNFKIELEDFDASQKIKLLDSNVMLCNYAKKCLSQLSDLDAFFAQVELEYSLFLRNTLTSTLQGDDFERTANSGQYY